MEKCPFKQHLSMRINSLTVNIASKTKGFIGSIARKTFSEICDLHTNLTGPKTTYISLKIKENVDIFFFSIKFYRTIT